MVGFWLDAATSGAGFDKVTGSKSNKTLCAICLTTRPGGTTRCDKGGKAVELERIRKRSGRGRRGRKAM